MPLSARPRVGVALEMPALWLVPPGPGSVLVGWGARKRVGEQEHVPASKVGWGGAGGEPWDLLGGVGLRPCLRPWKEIGAFRH